MSLSTINVGELGSVARTIINALITAYNNTLEPNVKKHKFDATTYPTVNDDVNSGYSVGSISHDITNDQVYICIDPTAGAAIWIKVSIVHAISGTPTTANNLSNGHKAGDIWINTSGTGAELYVCTASSLAAATWVSVSDVFEDTGSVVKLKTARNIDLQNLRLLNVLDPSEQLDGMNLKSVEKKDSILMNRRQVHPVDFASYSAQDVVSGSATLKTLTGVNSVHNGLGSIMSMNPLTGVIVSITTAAPNHSDNARNVYIRRSTDGGMTWSTWTSFSSQLTYSSGIKPCNLAYITMGKNKGRLIFTYRDVYVSYYSFSDDEGVTWSTPVEIKTLTPSGLVSGDSNNFTLSTANGSIVEWYDIDGNLNIGLPLSVKYTDGSVYRRLGLLVSKDEGESFDSNDFIGTTAEVLGAIYGGEPDIVDLGNGIFICVQRDTFNTGTAEWRGMTQYISYNYGADGSWELQGVIPYDMKWINDHNQNYLMSLSKVFIKGEEFIVMDYTSRYNNSTNHDQKRLIARPKDLIGSNGHSGWIYDTLDVTANYGAYNACGNGYTLYPYKGNRALFTGSKQSASTNSDFVDYDVTIDEDAVYETILNSDRKNAKWKAFDYSKIGNNKVASSSSVIDITDTSKLEVGMPIRCLFAITASTQLDNILNLEWRYYVITAITIDTSITVAGRALPTAAGTYSTPAKIYRLEIGSYDSIVNWQELISGTLNTGYASVDATHGLLFEDQLMRNRFRWLGGKAHIVKFWQAVYDDDTTYDRITPYVSSDNSTFNAAASTYIETGNTTYVAESGVIMNAYADLEYGDYIDFTLAVGTGDGANMTIGLVIITE